mmetsp:Transcript_35385/g.80950  ORF Transcript_35385/g.80950 Transcript_35385/m.80950 type:complete len:221 (-) Transcript_35385:510-1172(-)
MIIQEGAPQAARCVNVVCVGRHKGVVGLFGWIIIQGDIAVCHVVQVLRLGRREVTLSETELGQYIDKSRVYVFPRRVRPGFFIFDGFLVFGPGRHFLRLLGSGRSLLFLRLYLVGRLFFRGCCFLLILLCRLPLWFIICLLRYNFVLLGLALGRLLLALFLIFLVLFFLVLALLLIMPVLRFGWFATGLLSFSRPASHETTADRLSWLHYIFPLHGIFHY